MIEPEAANEVAATDERTYTARLGIPTPPLDDLVRSERVRTFTAMCLALLEHGRPMLLLEIVARLERAGLWVPTGDLAHSLLKAWHGQAPVYRDAQGRFGLELSSRRLSWMILDLELAGSRRPPLPREEPAVPGDEVPLSEDEVEALFHHGSPSLSLVRQIAAVLDAHRMPLPLRQVVQTLNRLSKSSRPIVVHELPQSARARLVERSADDLLHLTGADEAIRAMRHDVRRRALPRRQLLQQRRLAECQREATARNEERERQQEHEAAQLRRAILHPSPEHRPAGALAQAFALLDLQTRVIRTFLADERAQIADCLAAYDLLAGLDVRGQVASLGSDGDRWRLIDLAPPRKQRRLNRAGRLLAITPQLVITGTVGISRPLGDPVNVVGYLARGEDGKLRRRLESDVKALAALYRFGVLHGCVRLRWGFLDEYLPVDWAAPGDLSLYTVAKRAQEASRSVDVVVGHAPGWERPWSRAWRGRVVTIDASVLALATRETTLEIPRHEIQAIRVVE